jgi:hypothetical protein
MQLYLYLAPPPAHHPHLLPPSGPFIPFLLLQHRHSTIHASVCFYHVRYPLAVPQTVCTSHSRQIDGHVPSSTLLHPCDVPAHAGVAAMRELPH